MPDFEPVIRNLALHLAKDEQARRELIAYHRGLDKARIEIAMVVGIVAVLVLLSLLI